MGHITTRYSGNSTQAGNCRFRLLFSAQLFCLCPLPSWSNRNLKHEPFVAFQLLMQAGPFFNFRSLVFADIRRFDALQKTHNTPSDVEIWGMGPPHYCTGAVRETFHRREPNQHGLWPVSASQRRGVAMHERRHQKKRARCGGGATCRHAAPPFSLAIEAADHRAHSAAK